MITTIGIERERFIIKASSGKIVPAIGELLPRVQRMAQAKRISPELFGYELFAGQIEDRTPPCKSLADLRRSLKVNDEILNELASQNGLGFSFTEFAGESEIEALVVNPFNERHKKIWDEISPERRLAASRVAAVHVHIGCGAAQALRLINLCDRSVIDRLSKLGDHSNGRRIAAYRIMTQSESVPPRFSDIGELLEYIKKHGSERNVWDLVRYRPSYGTTEFRMFGITPDIEEIIGFVRACLNLFKSIR